MQFCKANLCCYVRFREKRLSPAKPFFWSVFCNSSENCTIWPWGGFTGTSTLGKLVLTHTWMLQKICFFRGTHMCWWSINQMHSIIRTWLLLILLIPVEAVSMYFQCNVIPVVIGWEVRQEKSHSTGKFAKVKPHNSPVVIGWQNWMF